MRHLSSKVVLVVAAIAGVALLAAQTPAQKRSFEVASIKPSAARDNRFLIRIQPGGRYVISNSTFKSVIAQAYGIRDFQISGGPNWISKDRWNIEAKAEEGSIPPPTRPLDPTVPGPLEIMMQSLIEDRFHLKMHRETKQLPI